MSQDNRTFLSLGSNLNDRLFNLKNGIEMLNDHPHIWVLKTSYFYKSEPMYNKNQRSFFNAVVEIDTNLVPQDLLYEVKNIEKLNGRTKVKGENMPRTLDIDIIAIGDLCINNKSLNIPHDKIAERKFVLKPWTDIAEAFKVITYNLTVGQLLKITSDLSELTLILDKEGQL